MSESLLTISHVAMYPDECVDIYHPDTGVRTMDDFVRRVDKHSLSFIDDQPEITEGDENYQERSNVFKGDMLEVFAEIFFGAHAYDPMVGIHSYHPVPLTEDYGVDATGINVVGLPVAIQCKFRSDPRTAITFADMAKTYTSGRIRHHLPLDGNDTVILFTTANNITKACKEVFGTQLRMINRNIIKLRVDNNTAFWQQAEQRLVATLNTLSTGDIR